MFELQNRTPDVSDVVVLLRNLIVSNRWFSALGNRPSLIEDNAIELTNLLEGFTTSLDEDTVLSGQSTTNKQSFWAASPIPQGQATTKTEIASATTRTPIPQGHLATLLAVGLKDQGPTRSTNR
jgi:O6-methylguanine-DNA--protein-cysteine methyltransferase